MAEEQVSYLLQEGDEYGRFTLQDDTGFIILERVTIDGPWIIRPEQTDGPWIIRPEAT